MNISYSFIIPHHNTPDLLQRLINTIPQRGDIEIIVVDDNSDEDKKAHVTRPDVKTIYIDKEHTKGAGKARNVGMDAATGKWLLFADADDLYKPGFIDILDEYKDDDIEILFFNVDSVDSDTLESGHNRTALEQKCVIQYDGTKDTIDELLFLCWGPWRKMLSREYVKTNHFFYEEISKGNDVLFSLATSYFARKWKLDKRILYTLTFRQESLTYSKMTSTKCITTLKNIRKREEFMKFIGHKDWISTLNRTRYITCIPRYIVGKTKFSPILGMKIMFIYLTHALSIERGAKYYVKVILELQKNIIK